MSGEEKNYPHRHTYMAETKKASGYKAKRKRQQPLTHIPGCTPLISSLAELAEKYLHSLHMKGCCSANTH
jgi:hypothetical protein